MINTVNFINWLTLDAELNTEKKILEYLQISRSTWYRKKNKGLTRCEFDALRSRDGYMTAPNFEGFRIIKDKIYAPNGQFITSDELANMWLYRQIKSLNNLNDERYINTQNQKVFNF